MRKIYKICTFLTLSLFLYVSLPAQELVQVLDETMMVNSRTALTGYTRNITGVTLPENAKGYVYRISVFKKGESKAGYGLLGLLKTLGARNISLGISLSQFVISNNDNESVDAFIFTNSTDASNFYAKKDGSWGACRSMPNRVNCCFSTSDCMTSRIYFGFRNNNISQGLDVKLEIVAIVD